MSGASSEETFDPTVPPEKQKVTYQTKDGRIKTVTKAELQEQMEASEKLMQSLNETWEEKLQRTHEVQKEREKALEELGITVEKNLVGVHTPKKVNTDLNIEDIRSLHKSCTFSLICTLFIRMSCKWLIDVIFRCRILSIWCVPFHVCPSSEWLLSLGV